MIGARVPAHYDVGQLEISSCGPWLIGTLLEEGDTRDLRWLMGRFGPESLRLWLAQRGARQLSARSRAFWSIVLEVDEPGTPGGGGDLWPL